MAAGWEIKGVRNSSERDVARTAVGEFGDLGLGSVAQGGQPSRREHISQVLHQLGVFSRRSLAMNAGRCTMHTHSPSARLKWTHCDSSVPRRGRTGRTRKRTEKESDREGGERRD